MDGSRRVSARPPSGSASREEGAGAAADAAAAADARKRYRLQGMATLDPDPLIAPLLGPGEDLLAVRRCVDFELRPASDGQACAGRGDLYLTSIRLVVLAQSGFEICIHEIEEAMLSSGRLLMVLRGGAGLSVEVDRPELLRVEIAAARAAARG